VTDFLLDEHLASAIQDAAAIHAPHLRIHRIGRGGAPGLGSPDPFLLSWCEEHDAYLVTDNRRSMPGHLREYLAQGRHVPGIFVVGERLSLVELVAEFELIHGASEPGEHADRISYLPLR
jgi:hypothetical protein